MLQLKPFSELGRVETFFADLAALDQIVLKFAGPVYDSATWTENQFRYALPRKEEISFAAVQENILIGFSIGYAFLPHWHHISRVAIHPAKTGKGIAKKMLATQKETMLSLNPSLITVDTTTGNDGAIKLYSGLGFTKIEGSELEAYVSLRHREPSEYLGDSPSHLALIFRRDPNFYLIHS